MGDNPESDRVDIEALLGRIVDIIAGGELPPNLAGDLISRSLEGFYEKLSNRLDMIQVMLHSRRKSPALLALVEPKVLEQAFGEFKAGRPEIGFAADTEIGKAAELPIKNVYFKLTGTPAVVARAKFIEVTKDNPPGKRMVGSEGTTGKFYYVFRELTWLPPIPLSSLRYFSSGTTVPNAVPGACIIEEIPAMVGC